MNKNKHKILDSARTLEILKQDLGLLPPPSTEWVIIEPVECGHYIANNIEYVFKDGQLIEASECKEEECKDKKGKKQKSNCDTCTKETCVVKDLKGYRKAKEDK